jgi:hypothetical protein
MAEEKSLTAIVDSLKRAINVNLIYELPTPSCPLKKQKNEWKIKEVKKLLIEKLNQDISQ